MIARMMRSSLVEELGEDYVDSARAKVAVRTPGDPPTTRCNALVPTVTVIGLSLGVFFVAPSSSRSSSDGRARPVGHRRRPAWGPRDGHGLRPGNQHRVPVVNLVVDVVYAYLDRRAVAWT